MAGATGDAIEKEGLWRRSYWIVVKSTPLEVWYLM